MEEQRLRVERRRLSKKEVEKSFMNGTTLMLDDEEIARRIEAADDAKELGIESLIMPAKERSIPSSPTKMVIKTSQVFPLDENQVSPRTQNE